MNKRPLQRACALGLTVTLVAGGATAATSPTPIGAIRQLKGKAFATSGDRLMYIESHWLYDADGAPSRLVLYRCPDGQPFARKQVEDDGSAQAPDFELYDGRTGYREGVRRLGGQRIVFVRKHTGARERSAVLHAAPAPVIDAGFDAYIRSHWNSLGSGGTATVPFVIPSRLGTLKFSVKRLDDARVNGRAAHRYRLGLASWIGFALPHIDVAYDARTRELLRFVGLANIRGSNGDNVRARITFDPSTEHSASVASLQAAFTAPLTGRCPIP